MAACSMLNAAESVRPMQAAEGEQTEEIRLLLLHLLTEIMLQAGKVGTGSAVPCSRHCKDYHCVPQLHHANSMRHLLSCRWNVFLHAAMQCSLLKQG